MFAVVCDLTKLLFSLAIELAKLDAQRYQPFIKKLAHLVKQLQPHKPCNQRQPQILRTEAQQALRKTLSKEHQKG